MIIVAQRISSVVGADTIVIIEDGRKLLVIVEGRDAGENSFPTPQALLDYATIQLLWSWYRRDRRAANERLLQGDTDPDGESL